MMGSIPQTAVNPVFLPGARAFGGDFAPPRQLYMIIFPAVLLFAGALSWAMSNETGLVLAAVVGSAIGVFSLWDWLFRYAPTRFSTLMGIAFLLGYALGTMNTWLTLPRGSLTLSEVMGLDPGVLARGMGAVLFSTSLLYFFGEIVEKPLFGRDFRLHLDQKARAVIYAGTMIFLVQYLTHKAVFAGIGSPNGHPGVLAIFLSFLCVPLTGLSVISFLSARPGFERLFSGLCALCFVMRFAIEGRRAAIYTSIIIILLLGLAGYRWKEKIFRKILLLLALGGIVVACSLTFMLLRLVGGLTPNKHLALDKRVAIAGKLIQRGSAYNLAVRATQQNLQKRTFVLAFLANIQDASFRVTPALGRDAANLGETAIPHILYPDKRSVAEEQLVDQQFGFSYGDQANSVLTAGATDFGFIGILFYPLIMVLIFKLLHNLLATLLSPVPLMFVTISFIACMLVTESTLTGYFEVLRDGPLFAAMLMLVLAFLPVNRTNMLSHGG
jgi:hypothetical protein